MIGSYPIIFKNIAVIILGGTIFWIKTAHILKDGEENFMKLAFVKRIKKFTKKRKN